MTNELWLRRSMRFEILLDSETGDGAAFRCEVSPSQHPPAQVVTWPSDLILFGLTGRGELVTEDGERCILGPASCVRIRRGGRVFLRNELREIWRFFAVLVDGGAEAFLEALGLTGDESELVDQARAVGCELYLPPDAPDLPEPIRALENRIPMQAVFSL